MKPLGEYADPETAVDSEAEWKLCLVGIPAAFLVALVMHRVIPGMQRIVFTMPLHEMGHAVSAWLCGFFAIPMPWMTRIPEERSFIAPILVVGGMGYLALRAWRAEKWLYVGLCAAVLVLAAAGTLGLKPNSAQALITFFGDGLGLVFGTLLMASFFF